MRISLANSDRRFSASPAQTVLEAALAAGLALPHGCKGGNCGVCRARLLRGRVRYPGGPPLGLSTMEADEGSILLCRAVAETDLHIDAVQVSAPGTAAFKRLPCRLERLEYLAPDVAVIRLRLPAAEPFVFLPGQYLDILLEDGRRRSFSIASPPHDARLLELHVRRAVGGELSERLFAAGAGSALPGSLWAIEGPFGRMTYRHDAAADPLLLVAGGTGFAPLKSILRHVVETPLRRPLALYWGARDSTDLYAHQELLALTQRVPQFRYVPVLSAPSAGWRGRRACVHDAVLEDVPVLAGAKVYAAGPPAMIAALARDFTGRGLPPANLRIDAFDYAWDSLQRHRTIADSRS